MTAPSDKTLVAIKFDKASKRLEILDQLLLPYSTKYLQIQSIEDAFQAIKLMQVRGAPAIAIVGAFAIVADTFTYLESGTNTKTIESLVADIDYLITSRPTAVNLSNALNDIKKLTATFNQQDVVNQEVFQLIYDYSIRLYEDDLANNFKIGENGLNYIKQSLQNEQFTGPFSIMTICNTGSLATSGHGTALGIIRSTFQGLKKGDGDFWLDHVYPCETRPYNQGAKLTTYELKYEEIPFTLVCDNMVSSLISSLNNGKSVKGRTAPVKFIIVGADRVVENGDTANKIGTFQLSAIASHFNTTLSADKKIKFMVAAPRTTIDLNTKTGEDIVIEERPASELTTLQGPMIEDGKVGKKVTVGIATPEIEVWNPAFDVTPHLLIDCIVTEEKNVFVKVNGKFDLSEAQ